MFGVVGSWGCGDLSPLRSYHSKTSFFIQTRAAKQMLTLNNMKVIYKR